MENLTGGTPPVRYLPCVVPCKLYFIGVDINSEALKRCQEKCDFDYETNAKVYLKQGDARNLGFIPSEGIDFICTHPPYANIIKYSENIPNDLSHLSEDKFLDAMKDVAKESYRVLKKKKYCAILIGDIRIKGYIIPLSFQVMQMFQSVGFLLKEIIIKEQHNCKSTTYWKERSQKYNFFLLAHEFLFIFERG